MFFRAVFFSVVDFCYTLVGSIVFFGECTPPASSMIFDRYLALQAEKVATSITRVIFVALVDFI